MIRRSISRRQSALIGLASLFLLLGLYTWLSHRQHVKNPDDTTMPSWSQLREGVVNMVEANPRSGERWLVVDGGATLSRFFMGLLAGVAIAIVLGVLMGCYPKVEAFLWPPLSFFAKVPPTAALAVFFVMVGTDTEMYVAMIAFGVVPVLAQSIYLAVLEIPEELLNKSLTLGASRGELIWNVIRPIILPKLITPSGSRSDRPWSISSRRKWSVAMSGSAIGFGFSHDC
ncbi:MAG: ABC transporter permease subunit [Verrucomicrobiota bacterium]